MFTILKGEYFLTLAGTTRQQLAIHSPTSSRCPSPNRAGTTFSHSSTIDVCPASTFSTKTKNKKTHTCPGLGKGLTTFFGGFRPPKTSGTNGANGAFFSLLLLLWLVSPILYDTHDQATHQHARNFYYLCNFERTIYYIVFLSLYHYVLRKRVFIGI